MSVGGSKAPTITGSVGKGGKNLPADVKVVQDLLNRNTRPPLLMLATDGIAGQSTTRAIETFQRNVVKLSRPDGRVDLGGMTWKALLATWAPSSPFGFGGIVPPPGTSIPKVTTTKVTTSSSTSSVSGAYPGNDPTWFPTKTLSSKGEAWTRKTFGDFDYTPKPATASKQPITILGDWESKNIVQVEIPQLKGVSTYGGKMGGKVKFHRLAAKQLVALWAAWQAAGLIHLVQFWDGGFYPRYQTSSKTKLSNHSWGTAFDINAQWNGYNKNCAAMGAKGCVLPLVPIAEKHGFAWGGFFPSKDGMHFEVAELK